MANNFVTNSIIAKSALAHLENELVLGAKVNNDFSEEFTSVGDTISVRRPNRFLGQENNLDISSYNEDLNEAKIPVTMDQTITIPFEIEAKDMTLSVESDKFQQRYIQPAVIRMKDIIETRISAKYSEIANFGGTAGTTIDTLLKLGEFKSLMTKDAAHASNRCAFHDPDVILALADGLKSVFPEKISKKAIEAASIGRYAGFDNFESVHMPVHTVGDYGGTPLVNGADQDVAYTDSDDIDSTQKVHDTDRQNLVTDGWSNSKTGLLKKGDVITIDGVYAVNPISKQSTGKLRTFVVNSDADSDGSGNSTLVITPAIITSGAYQNCSAAPADDATITVKTGAANSQHQQSMFFHKDAMTLVTRPLKISDVGLKTKTVMGNRMSLSITETGDFNTLKHRYRLDCLFGVAFNHQNLACRGTN